MTPSEPPIFAVSPDGAWRFEGGALRSATTTVVPFVIDFFERWTLARFLPGGELLLAFESGQPWTYDGSYGDRYGGVELLALTLPAAATGLQGARVTGGVRLAWTDTAANERAFRIERSPAGGASFLEVGRAAANAVAFTDATAASGVAYEYRVFATNERGDSATTGVVLVP